MRIRSAAAFCALLFTACQPNSFKITGTAALADGDTILLTRTIDTSLPTDTMVVSEGAFQYQGVADSAVLALLYTQKNPDLCTTLFLEPGTIDVSLSEATGQTRIGGTAANDALQEANYLAFRYSERIQELSLAACQTETDDSNGLLIKAQLERLKRDFTQKIIHLAERNIDNEFGYMIIINLEDEDFPLSHRLELIEKMPQDFRQRAEAQAFIRGDGSPEGRPQ